MDNLGLFFAYLAVGFMVAQLVFIAFTDLIKRSALSVMGMVLLTLVLTTLYGTKNALLFFVLWEASTWLTYLLANNPDKAKRYLWISLLGEFGMLIALLRTIVLTGSFELSALAKMDTLTVVLFCMPFVIKSGIFPFHFWVGDLYTGSDKRFVGYLSAIIGKLGIFGLIRVLSEIGYSGGGFWPNLFIYFAGITAVWATFRAVASEDAIEALSFSSLSQVAFIFASVLLWGSFALSGAMLHYLNHLLIKAGMFFAVVYIWSKIGSTLYTSMGDFVRKMPFTFLFFLMLGISLAGVPPMGGFNSKWLMYEAFIEKGRLLPVLFFFVAGVGSFLYVYRLLHSIFLGRKKVSIRLIKEMNPITILPLAVSAVVAFVVGVYVKPFMAWIGKALSGLVEPASFTQTSLGVADISLVGAIFGALVLFAIVFWWILPRHRYAPDTEGYTAAAYLPEQIKLWDYSYNFYAPVNRLGEGFVKLISLEWVARYFEEYIAGLGQALRGIYNGSVIVYASYIFLTMMILLEVLLKLTGKGL